MSNSGSILNLLVLGIAIILLIVLINQNPSSRGDSFVGKVPMMPIGNGFYPPGYVPGVQPMGQPMIYPQQIYPAKLPYIDDSVNNVGRPCGGNDCGAFGSCINGVCSINRTDEDNNTTVFNMKI